MRKQKHLPLDMALNYTTRYEISVDSKPLKPKKNKGYSRMRALHTKIINTLMVFTLLGMGAFSVSLPAAHAEPGNPVDYNNLCAKDIIYNANAVNPGSFDPAHPKGDVKLTGAEKFGYSTLRFPVVTGPWEKKDSPDGLKDANYKSDSKFFAQNNGGCLKPFWQFYSGTANGLISGASMISGINGMLFDTAIRAGEKDGALATLSNTVERIVTGKDNSGAVTTNGKGLRDTLFIEFMIPVVMLAAAFILFKTLAQRKFTEALSDIVWLVCSLAMGVLILNDPMMIPRAAETTVSSASGAIISGITDTAMNIAPGGANSNLCSVGKESSGADASSRQVQCLLWYGTAFRPWQIGTFGTNNEQSIRASEVPAVGMGGGSNATPSDWSIYYLDQQWKTSETNQADIDQKKTNVMKLVRVYVGDPYNGNGGQVNTSFTGEDANKIGISSVGAIESLVCFIIIAPLSVTIVAMKIMLQLMVIALSFLLLLCAFPTFGRRLTTKFANTIIGLVLKQIVMSLVLGVAMALMSIAINMPNPLVALILIIVMAYAVDRFKSMIMDLTQVNIGGAGSFETPDPGQALRNGMLRGPAVAAGTVMGGGAALLGRMRGVSSNKPGGTEKETTSSSKGTMRAMVPEALGKEGMGETSNNSPAPSTETVTSRRAPVRRTPGIPDAQGFSGKPVSTAVPVLSGAKSSGAKVSGSSMAKTSEMMRSQDNAPKHRATSNAVPVRTPDFMKEGPIAPKSKSVAAVVAAGAIKGGTRAAMSGSTSLSAGLTTGFEAGQEVATDANSEHAANVRQAERDLKAAHKAEETRYQERKKAAEAERILRSKASEKETGGGLPVRTPASGGLPASPRKPVGLPSRSSSSGSTGGTVRAGSR